MRNEIIDGVEHQYENLPAIVPIGHIIVWSSGEYTGYCIEGVGRVVTEFKRDEYCDTEDHSVRYSTLEKKDIHTIRHYSLNAKKLKASGFVEDIEYTESYE